MSQGSSRAKGRFLRRWLTVGIVSLACWQVPAEVTAQNRPTDEPIRRLAQFQEVAAQKLEAEARLALDEAVRLEPISRDRAITRLKQAIALIDTDTVLSSERKRRIIQPLALKIRALETAARQPQVGDDPAKQRARESEKQLAAKHAAEAQQLRQAISEIDALVKADRLDEAARKAKDLQQRFPNNPAALAFNYDLSMKERVAEAQYLLAEQNQRIVLAMRAIDKSALPPIDDIEFPKDWKTKRRYDPYPLSAKEKAILRALSSPINLDCKDKPFEEVIQYISDAMQQPILIDKGALADAQIESNTPVTVNLKGVSARSGLRKVLQDLGLAYVVRNETIIVTSQLRAREMLVTRAYYLGDVIQGVGMFGGAPIWGPFLDQQQTLQNAQAIIQSIQSTIDPSSWRANGGVGTIEFHFPSMSLIVRQSAEVHSMLRSSFGGGR